MRAPAQTCGLTNQYQDFAGWPLLCGVSHYVWRRRNRCQECDQVYQSMRGQKDAVVSKCTTMREAKTKPHRPSMNHMMPTVMRRECLWCESHLIQRLVFFVSAALGRASEDTSVKSILVIKCSSTIFFCIHALFLVASQTQESLSPAILHYIYIFIASVLRPRIPKFHTNMRSQMSTVPPLSSL